jgi:phospholipid-binding lipoprotein MlaA
MSRHVQLFGLLAWCVGAGVLCADPAIAAAPDGARPDPSQTTFVDLTAPATQAPATSRAYVPDSVPSTAYVDLTKGDTPGAMPERSVASASYTPRTRHIDLSNGASPPPLDDMEEPPPPPQPIDTITITADRLADPFEDTNRGRFRTHVGLHRYVIDPIERAYIFVAPVPVREGLHNFLTNLETPSVLFNDLFQGDLDRAGNTMSRFVVNSTIGIGGIFDFAARAGLAYRDDDFGATLATYGVGDYPYLLVPLIGPSNPRDLGGKVVDFVMDPLHFVTLPGGIITSIGHTGLHQLDKRSVDVGELDMLAKTSPDAYAEERAKSRAERNTEIHGAEPPQH